MPKTYDPELISLLLGASKNFRDSTPRLVAADKADECAEANLAVFLRYSTTIDPKHINSQMLFTGSRCYGNWFTSSSDVDWVMCVTRETENTLRYLANDIIMEYGEAGKDVSYYGSGQTRMAVRLSPLNLILIRTERQWRCWKQGTQRLCRMRRIIDCHPEGRAHAIKLFDRKFQALDEDRLHRTPIHWNYISRSTVETLLEDYISYMKEGSRRRVYNERIDEMVTVDYYSPTFSEWLMNNNGFSDELARLAVCIRYELQEERNEKW